MIERYAPTQFVILQFYSFIFITNESTYYRVFFLLKYLCVVPPLSFVFGMLTFVT